MPSTGFQTDADSHRPVHGALAGARGHQGMGPETKASFGAGGGCGQLARAAKRGSAQTSWHGGSVPERSLPDPPAFSAPCPSSATVTPALSCGGLRRAEACRLPQPPSVPSGQREAGGRFWDRGRLGRDAPPAVQAAAPLAVLPVGRQPGSRGGGSAAAEPLGRWCFFNILITVE